MRPGRLALLYGFAATAIAVTAAPAFADSCSNLAATVHRPNTTITTAQTVPAGSFTPPGGAAITGLPAFCRVAGFTTPTSDSHIEFEVWIPSTGWNQKYLQVGCGGFCGAITYSALAEPLRRGYATAATDDGHEAGAFDGSFAVGHPEKVVDYGIRAVKETGDTAKAIILAFESGSARAQLLHGMLGRRPRGAHGGAALPR